MPPLFLVERHVQLRFTDINLHHIINIDDVRLQARGSEVLLF